MPLINTSKNAKRPILEVNTMDDEDLDIPFQVLRLDTIKISNKNKLKFDQTLSGETLESKAIKQISLKRKFKEDSNFNPFKDPPKPLCKMNKKSEQDKCDPVQNKSEEW